MTLTGFLSAVIGLVVGAGLATVKYVLDQRARRDEDLWSRRFDPYREAWALTSQFSRWPRQNPTIGDTAALHKMFRLWFYGNGGILMSSHARARYTYVQEGLAALCRRGLEADSLIKAADYDDVEEIMSGFRAALTADLESRRKRSIVWSIIDLRKNRKTKADLKERLCRLQLNNPGPHACLWRRPAGWKSLEKHGIRFLIHG